MQIPFIQQLSVASRQQLVSEVQSIAVKRGQTIIQKGQAVAGAYFVAEGSLRIYALDHNGNEKPIYQLIAGEICVFSINCVLGKVRYPAWVGVESDTALVQAIPAPLFRRLYETETAARDYVFNSLSQQMFDLMSQIEEVSTQDLDSRINSFLVRACPEDGVLKISHQEIAERLGTAREVVSRHLKSLEQQGLLKLGRMRVELL
ncbi:MAG: Crp/Fnr family transcriptional regulator, partial [Cellvibrionaceae bacterium]|nr:Crp/Fnr family transcriptional regulator [Cellvibrionaceae bacterium]